MFLMRTQLFRLMPVFTWFEIYSFSYICRFAQIKGLIPFSTYQDSNKGPLCCSTCCYLSLAYNLVRSLLQVRNYYLNTSIYNHYNFIPLLLISSASPGLCCTIFTSCSTFIITVVLIEQLISEITKPMTSLIIDLDFTQHSRVGVFQTLLSRTEAVIEICFINIEYFGHLQYYTNQCIAILQFEQLHLQQQPSPIKMNEYQIKYSLVIPRFFLFRFDVLPFLICYTILAYCFLTLQDAGNTYIYMRLSFVGLGFVNCLTYIFGHWSKKIQALIQYKQIKGNMQSNLLKASHVYVRQKIPGYAWTYGLCDLYLLNPEKIKQQIFFFYFQQRKFYFNKKINNFTRLKPQLSECTTKQVINREYEAELYDDNILQIPIKPFSEIFKDQIVDPFQFFQLFSVLLWLLDENGGYSLFILFMIIFSSYTIAAQRIKTLVGYRSMTISPHEVKTWRNNKWTPISTYDLKPGDYIIVQPGYQHKKCPHQTMTDEQYLKQALPFASKLPRGMTQTTKKEQNNSYRTVPCDILLLSGSCVANQSILTGQAIPQIKQSINTQDLPSTFNTSLYKHSILFCGTQMLQINDNLHEDQIRNILKVDQTTVFNYNQLPPKGCLGLVLATGFDTSKGKLIRRVVANAQNLKLEQKDGLWIVLFLLICSLITSAYVLDQGMDNESRSKEKLFLRCILIITTVVPPQLPMIMTLTVNNSILELQKKKIFISEPKKIPLGGKIDTIAFDKTGTLTQDKFIFQGIVDDCENYKTKKNFKNCKSENCAILAGCHSLITVDQKLSGDPIELMFFEETDWEYSSKNKQARRNLQRVIIKKVYPFRSQLKRMSAIAQHIPVQGQTTTKILVKGAPEAIQKLLKKVPNNYEQAYKFYTKQGYRLLALAFKIVNQVQENVNKEVERSEVEKDLQFAGFFICNSPLKEDTKKNITNLQEAKFKILIITGDNILTAIKVGLMLNMGSEPYILEKEDDKVILSRQQEREQITSPEQLKAKIKDPQAMICTSSTKQLDPHYYPYITIFARTSPQDKQNIVKKIKQLTGAGILYAGDGTNDMGGLRTADVGVAVIGTTGISQTQKKQEQFKQEQKKFKKRMDEIRSDPSIPLRNKLEIMKNLATDYKSKNSGNNAFGFLQQDEVKVGDACFAAPFTSKHSNSIKCVIIILRQSIATLVTTIQTYKILAISSMIQAYSLAEMNLINLKYSQSQTLVVGILASINLYFFSNVKPVKKISHIRAPHTIFSIWFAISFFGQIIIFIFCNYYALNKIGLKYLPEADKNVSADSEFKKSFLNTVIFLFSAISQSTVFIANHGGQPHMISLLKSGKQFKFLIIPLVVCFIMTANVFPDLAEMFDLKYEGVDYNANIEMLVVFGFMAISTYMIERLCRFAQYKQFVGWF